MTMGMKPFENIAEKGENADNQHFLLLPQRFLLYQENIPLFFFFFGGGGAIYSLSSANAVYLDQSKILSFGEEESCLV